MKDIDFDHTETDKYQADRGKAALVPVTFENTKTNKIITKLAILDTASPVTQLPPDLISDLNVDWKTGFVADPEDPEKGALGLKFRSVKVLQVMLKFDPKVCEEEQIVKSALLSTDGYVHIGRDILRNANLTINWSDPVGGCLKIKKVVG